MCDQPCAFLGVRASKPLTNSFTIVGSLQVPQPGLDCNSSVTYARISESDDLDIDGRGCPVLGLDVAGTAELSERIEAAADQSQNAGVVGIVPEDLIEDFGELQSLGVCTEGLEFGNGDFDADHSRARAGLDLRSLNTGIKPAAECNGSSHD